MVAVLLYCEVGIYSLISLRFPFRRRRRFRRKRCFRSRRPLRVRRRVRRYRRARQRRIRLNESAPVVRYVHRYASQHGTAYSFGCGHNSVQIPSNTVLDFTPSTPLFFDLLTRYCKVGINSVYWKIMNMETKVWKIDQTQLAASYSNFSLIEKIFGIVTQDPVTLITILNKTALIGYQLLDGLARFGIKMINETYTHNTGPVALYRRTDVCTSKLDSRPFNQRGAKRVKIRFCCSIKGKRNSKIRNFNHSHTIKLQMQ